MRYDANIHHRQSIRLPTYDYGSVGAYFVTICSYRRKCIFDDPALKATAENAWRKVAAASKPADEFVVMPNHVHGIIWIREVKRVGAQQPRDQSRADISDRARSHTTGVVAAPLQPFALAQRPVVSGSLAAIVRAFKSATAKRINNSRGTPGTHVWQRNYYERVIRTERELLGIRQYILDNPRNWAEDPKHPGNLREIGE